MCSCIIRLEICVHSPSYRPSKDTLIQNKKPEKIKVCERGQGVMVFSGLFCDSYSFGSGAFRAGVLRPKFCPECGAPWDTNIAELENSAPAAA